MPGWLSEHAESGEPYAMWAHGGCGLVTVELLSLLSHSACICMVNLRLTLVNDLNWYVYCMWYMVHNCRSLHNVSILCTNNEAVWQVQLLIPSQPSVTVL